MFFQMCFCQQDFMKIVRLFLAAVSIYGLRIGAGTNDGAGVNGNNFFLMFLENGGIFFKKIFCCF